MRRAIGNVPGTDITNHINTTEEGRRYRPLIADDITAIEQRLSELDRSKTKSGADLMEEAALSSRRNSRLIQLAEIDRQLRFITPFRDWNHAEWSRTHHDVLTAMASLGAFASMGSRLAAQRERVGIAPQRGSATVGEAAVTPSQLRQESSGQRSAVKRPTQTSEAKVTGPKTMVMRSPVDLMGVEPASPELLAAVGGKRTLEIAMPGSESLRMLDYFGAEASVGGELNSSILLRQNPSKAAVLEEFLHGTQARLGIVDRLGTSGLGSAETHVKDFMMRHQSMLGLSNEDVSILKILRDNGL